MGMAIAIAFHVSFLLLAAVISMAPASAVTCQWMFSSGGAANFQNLAVGPALEGLRFGDFDADGKTDVFTVACG